MIEENFGIAVITLPYEIVARDFGLRGVVVVGVECDLGGGEICGKYICGENRDEDDGKQEDDPAIHFCLTEIHNFPLLFKLWLFYLNQYGLDYTSLGILMGGGIVVFTGEKGEPVVAIGFGEGGEICCGRESGVFANGVGVGEAIDLEGDLISIGEGFEIGEGTG